jgi:hypothetical protein
MWPGHGARAANFGAWRAFTARIWMQGGQPWVRGSLLTAVLWVEALAAEGRSPRSLRSELNQAARRTGEASMPITVRRGH